MHRHLHRAPALVAKSAICISLALGVSIPALLAAPAVGAAPAHSVAPHIPSASATAKLVHVPVGRMSITYDPATRSARTVLTMSGLSPAGMAVSVVLNGTCAAPGGVMWRGAPFTADANGKLVNFVVTYANVGGIPAPHVVAIETVQGGNEARANYLLSCGPIFITSTGGKNKGAVVLGPVTSAANGAVSGSATLSETNGALTIGVNVSGLVPGSTHASALHLGSCQWLSYVLYDLPTLTADGNGNASATITINNAQPLSSANNWYVAIDANSTLNRAYFMPVSCGNVVVS